MSGPSDAAHADNRDSKASTAPLLSFSQQSLLGAKSGDMTLAESPEVESKPRKRDFWKQFTKPDDVKVKNNAPSPLGSSSALAGASSLRPVSPLHSPDSLRGSASPQRGNYPYAARDSRPHSPASSMIFERDVQEDVAPASNEANAHLPSHIMTENHIPPALDDASEAITNSRLNPDTVEIVTHPAHQPAAFTITGAEQSMASSMHEDFAHRHDLEGGSNYGSLESTDVRRLSFISFADVVHAEHEHSDQRRDSLLGQPPLVAPRSPSPVRSPLSSTGPGTSPPTSVSAKGTETSPNRFRGTGSPVPTPGSPLSGELNIETMSHALKTAGNEDLGARSASVSAVGDDVQFNPSFK